MEPEHVDRSALPADVERDLCACIPTVGGEESKDLFDEGCMLLVEEPIKTFALPQQPNVVSRIDRGGHASDRSERDAIGTTTFDPTHRRLRGPRSTGQLLLRHPTTATERTDPESEPNDVHVVMVGPRASLRSICGRTSGGWSSEPAREPARASAAAT